MSTVVIRDHRGEQIGVVQLKPNSLGGTLTVDRVLSGKGTLLRHYFQGKRDVRIESGSFVLSGTLSTQWSDGCRAWQIQLSPAVPASRGLYRHRTQNARA
jgi:hypothetical protein